MTEKLTFFRSTRSPGRELLSATMFDRNTEQAARDRCDWLGGALPIAYFVRRETCLPLPNVLQCTGRRVGRLSGLRFGSIHARRPMNDNRCGCSQWLPSHEYERERERHDDKAQAEHRQR
eukprot:7019710-Prymnesium_polylepis.2